MSHPAATGRPRPTYDHDTDGKAAPDNPERRAYPRYFRPGVATGGRESRSIVGSTSTSAPNSPPPRRSRSLANRRTRRLRPASSKVRPLAVARIRTIRRSTGSWRVTTNPDRTSPATKRDIVGGRTCSARARSPSVTGPPNTTTESAEAWGPVKPVAASSTRSRRNKWIAAEWSLVAISAGLGRQSPGWSGLGTGIS